MSWIALCALLKLLRHEAFCKYKTSNFLLPPFLHVLLYVASLPPGSLVHNRPLWSEAKPRKLHGRASTKQKPSIFPFTFHARAAANICCSAFYPASIPQTWGRPPRACSPTA